jgi:hypothetical protein
VLYVVARIILRWSNAPRASERKRLSLGPNELVGGVTAILAFGALIAIIANFLA